VRPRSSSPRQPPATSRSRRRRVVRSRPDVPQPAVRSSAAWSALWSGSERQLGRAARGRDRDTDLVARIRSLARMARCPGGTGRARCTVGGRVDAARPLTTSAGTAPGRAGSGGERAGLGRDHRGDLQQRGDDPQVPAVRQLVIDAVGGVGRGQRVHRRDGATSRRRPSDHCGPEPAEPRLRCRVQRSPIHSPRWPVRSC